MTHDVCGRPKSYLKRRDGKQNYSGTKVIKLPDLSATASNCIAEITIQKSIHGVQF